MIERERTYLAKSMPTGLEECEKKELIDIYFPKEVAHPSLRLRQLGDKYEMTKKYRINPDDGSRLVEETISLNKEEFQALAKADGKRVQKIRYYLKYNNRTLEVDVFKDQLAGLVLIDAEFETDGAKTEFIMPEFCLAEVTQEEFVAGGKLCGKNYQDIEKDLARFGYHKLLRH